MGVAVTNVYNQGPPPLRCVYSPTYEATSWFEFVRLLLPWFGRLEHTTLSLHPHSSRQCGRTAWHSAQPLEYELVLFYKEGEIELIVKHWETYSIVFVTILFFVYTKQRSLYININKYINKVYIHVSLECGRRTPAECTSSDSLVTGPALPSVVFWGL